MTIRYWDSWGKGSLKGLGLRISLKGLWGLGALGFGLQGLGVWGSFRVPLKGLWGLGVLGSRL